MDGAAAPVRPELRIKTPRVDEEGLEEIRFNVKRRVCSRDRCLDGMVAGMMSGSGLFVLGFASGQMVAMQLGIVVFLGACFTSSVLHPPS